MVTYRKYGGANQYEVTARAYSGTGGLFRFSERFYDTLDKRFNAELHLGVQMNHNTGNQNITNSVKWSGFSKQALRIEELYIKDIYVSMDQPSSEEDTYTSVQGVVSNVDYGDEQMPDLSYEGCLGHGWIRNFYAVDAVADQNKLEVWNGVALLDMNDFLYGAAHNRHNNFNRQSPFHFHYDLLPVSKPLCFYHKSDAYSSAHSAWMLFKVIAMVKFLRKKRFWQL